MAGKPGGGERDLMMLPVMYRLWLAIQRPQLLEWSDKKVGWWDAAVRGSSGSDPAAAGDVARRRGHFPGHRPAPFFRLFLVPGPHSRPSYAKTEKRSWLQGRGASG